MSGTKRKSQKIRDPRPGYARVLRLTHIRPGRVACFVFFEGSIALAFLLGFAELISVWTALAIPVLVAVMVKMNDIIAGAVAGPADDVAVTEDILVRQWETDPAEDEYDEDAYDEDEYGDDVDSDGLPDVHEALETGEPDGPDAADEGGPDETADESEEEPDDDVDTDARRQGALSEPAAGAPAEAAAPESTAEDGVASDQPPAVDAPEEDAPEEDAPEEPVAPGAPREGPGQQAASRDDS